MGPFSLLSVSSSYAYRFPNDFRVSCPRLRDPRHSRLAPASESAPAHLHPITKVQYCHSEGIIHKQLLQQTQAGLQSSSSMFLRQALKEA